MKFHTIKFKNFMPYKGEVNVSFPQGDQNILLLHGLNSHGKTSFINGIRWCFYGRVLRSGKQLEYKKLLNNSAYDEKDYNFEVSIDFEHENSKYQLIRSVKASEKIEYPQDDSHFSMSSFLTKDGNVLGSSSEIVHQISLIAPEDVSRFFLFDGELLNEYSQLLEKQSDVGEAIKKSIEQILGVPSLMNGKKDINFLSRQVEKKQKKEVGNNKAINDLINSREQAEKHNEELKNANIELQKTILESRSEKELVDSYTDNFEEKNKLAIELGSIKKTNEGIDIDLKKLNIERLEITKDLWRELVRPQIKDLIEGSSDKNSELDSKHMLEILLNELNSSLQNKECTICGNNHLELSVIEKKIQEIKSKLNNFSNESSVNNKFLFDFLDNRNDRTLKSILTEISQKEFDKLANESRIDELIGSLGSAKEAEEIKSNYKRSAQLAGLIAQSEDEINKNNKTIESNEKEIREINEQIHKNPTAKDSPSTIYLNIYAQLYKLFDESIVELRDTFKKQVESKASEIFCKLNHRESYKSLRINDNYGLDIINSDDKLVEVRNAGAEQIVALSLIAGLATTGRKNGPIVMDTPFGRLDLTHRKNILETLPKFASQLVLFVHDGEVNQELAKEISPMVGKRYEIVLSDDGKNSLIREMR